MAQCSLPVAVLPGDGHHLALGPLRRGPDDLGGGEHVGGRQESGWRPRRRVPPPSHR